MFLRQIRNIAVLRRRSTTTCLNSNSTAGIQRSAAPHDAHNIINHQLHQPCRLASSSNKTSISQSPPETTPKTSTQKDTADDTRPAAADTTKADSDPTSSRTLLAQWHDRLEAENVPEIDSALRNILAHVLRVKRLDPEETTIRLTVEQLARFEELCECRLARMPLQYIIGEWDFRDLTLQMRPPVFIPRPETEELVELVLQQFDVKRPVRFLEIGCGSGAISLALLRALPKAQGVAIDQSEMACQLTLSNAQRHQLDGRLTVRKEKLTRQTVANGDGLGVGQVDGDEELDLIVSNPPYVPNAQLRGLQPEVKM